MCAKQLLQEHDPRELVRQRDRTERDPVHGTLEHRAREAEGATQDEPEVAPRSAAHGEELREGLARHRTSLAIERAERSLGGHALEDRLAFPLRVGLRKLDRLEACMACEQALVVGDVVHERRANLSDTDHDQAHSGCDTRRVSDDPERERHINMHMSPDTMAGTYANFANISHSDYEFTITFARLDHEVDDDEIPGVVVSRVSASPKFVRELIDALEDNYSKYSTREGIKNLPEYRGRGPETGDDQSRSTTS
jgi:hypothetical protein